MSEWQPIETAPKDGRQILVWDGWDINLAHWAGEPGNEERGFWQKNGDEFMPDIYGNLIVQWHPLPEPPQEEKS